MVLPDVNVLVYAHRQDALRHQEYLNWLNQVLNSDEAFGISDLVLSGFLRVVTHPRVFRDPTPLSLAQKFVVVIHDHPNAVTVSLVNGIGISFGACAKRLTKGESHR